MKKQSTEKFIIEAIEKHGDKYDYSKVVYENNLKEVTMTLDIFWDRNYIECINVKSICEKYTE